MLDSSYPNQASYAKQANTAAPQPPIQQASDRLDNALFQLHARLEVLATKLTPVLHSQAPQAGGADANPASDVGLVRQIDDATGRVQQAVRDDGERPVNG